MDRSPVPTVAPAHEVDITSVLEQKARAHPKKLNWRGSITDLLTLLGLDNSPEAREALATKLGCPPDLMKDSSEMNEWLHKTVMQKVAQNGGRVPADLQR